MPKKWQLVIDMVVALHQVECDHPPPSPTHSGHQQEPLKPHPPNMFTDVSSATESWTTYAYALKCAIHPLESVPFHNSNHDATFFHHFSTNNRSLQNSVT